MAAAAGASNYTAAGERERILQTLKETEGVVSGPTGAAARLGLKRNTLQFTHAEIQYHSSVSVSG